MDNIRKDDAALLAWENTLSSTTSISMTFGSSPIDSKHKRLDQEKGVTTAPESQMGSCSSDGTSLVLTVVDQQDSENFRNAIATTNCRQGHRRGYLTSGVILPGLAALSIAKAGYESSLTARHRVHVRRGMQIPTAHAIWHVNARPARVAMIWSFLWTWPSRTPASSAVATGGRRERTTSWRFKKLSALAAGAPPGSPSSSMVQFCELVGVAWGERERRRSVQRPTVDMCVEYLVASVYSVLDPDYNQCDRYVLTEVTVRLAKRNEDERDQHAPGRRDYHSTGTKTCFVAMAGCNPLASSLRRAR
ncbi:hypothetical protein MAPG_01935 [Magnaporthiopsis poae ATCC 64411]|uniref:Uncharacterized protein n=1 Tax=Magnaporthiopsis poae (strain ATCC 64411 / 73-15) TaxID=644358 RepID=A0A0C4DQ03_MAGP6|nr:hypothetical protein MAPG_01935 [Magnaporthiopsis poae ATCC 64411]